MTVANKITVSRFAVTIVYFVLLGLCGHEADSTLLYIAFFLFLAAVIGDGLDGYYARKYKQETNFGRIADPFADKILICGSFVFFLAIPPLREIVPAWMVVVILAREFLVTAIRSAAESQGIPFHASGWGKIKMIVQSFVVATAVFYAAHMSHFDWATLIMRVLIWITLVVTALSGILYLIETRRIFAGKNV
ncbi:MAG TPA: CDP-diacylglycerol--glycerol-3-phosphate 3-phosphatidyltransferase [Planctomycetota bacterium]|nr:CDP-diacylglycerol--glycerol-3-phosphate 3-phosphatidyltransferase [Planctomycetota bacterium]